MSLNPEESGVGYRPAGNGQERRLRLVAVVYPEWLPSWLVNVLVLWGFAACVLVGFLDVNDPGEAGTTLGHQPFAQLQKELGVAIQAHLAWPLFLWFCALILTLQYYILRRNHARQRWIYATISATLLSMALVILMHSPDFLNDPLDWLQQHLPPIGVPRVGEQGYAILWTVVNFALLGIFVWDANRRWARGRRGQSLNPHAGIALEGGVEAEASTIEGKPRWQELLSVDLLAGSIIAAVLAALFSSDLWQHFLGVASFHKCLTALPLGGCDNNKLPGLTDPLTLTFIDSVLALGAVVSGAVLLFLSATGRGLEVVGGEGAAPLETSSTISDSRVHRAVEVLDQANVALDMAADAARDMATGKTRELTPRGGRFLRPGLGMSVVLALRLFIVAVLILVGVASASVAASIIQYYVALLDHQHLRGYWFDSDGRNVAAVLGALGLVVIAALVNVFASATLVFSYTVVKRWLPRLGQIALLALILFWGFALGLLAFNLLLWLVAAAFSRDQKMPQPYFPPGFSVYISFIAFFVYRYWFRRLAAQQAHAGGRTELPPNRQ